MTPTVTYDPDTAILTVSGCQAEIRDLDGDDDVYGVGVSFDAAYQAELLARENVPAGCECPQLPVPTPLSTQQSGRVFGGQPRMLLQGGANAGGVFRFFHKSACPLRPDTPDYPPAA